MTSRQLTVALIGDKDESVTAHRAIPRALELAAGAVGVSVQHVWLGTDTIDSTTAIDQFNAIWCVPASPYRSEAGALHAIRFARAERVPFLGTCGGFQHAVLEYARNVLHWDDAGHAEIDSNGPRQVISPLTCGLVEVTAKVHFVRGSLIAQAYGTSDASEGYHCNYGLNQQFRNQLTSGELCVTAVDDAGAVRAVELNHHPFYVATLFQPERAALQGRVPPLVYAFLGAAAKT